jgi:MFS family permease
MNKTKETEKATWTYNSRHREMRLTPAFILALIFGGQVTPTMKNPNQPGWMGSFSTADFEAIIEEGRRQEDRTAATSEHVQTRAQWLLTVSLVVLAFGAGVVGQIKRLAGARLVAALLVFTAAVALVLFGLLLASAVIVVQADFDRLDTTQLSKRPSPIQPVIANEYASAVRKGEITVATRVTVFRIATRYTIWGAILAALALAVCGSAPTQEPPFTRSPPALSTTKTTTPCANGTEAKHRGCTAQTAAPPPIVTNTTTSVLRLPNARSSSTTTFNSTIGRTKP